MKIILLLSLMISLTWANHVQWQGDYDKALALAQKEHKPLFVLLVQKNCQPCLNLLKTYFMHQPYVEAINQKAVCVMITYEGEANYPIELYYSTRFPTLFIVDSQKELFLHPPIYHEQIDASMLEKMILNFTHN